MGGLGGGEVVLPVAGAAFAEGECRKLLAGFDQTGFGDGQLKSLDDPLKDRARLLNKLFIGEDHPRKLVFPGANGGGEDWSVVVNSYLHRILQRAKLNESSSGEQKVRERVGDVTQIAIKEDHAVVQLARFTHDIIRMQNRAGTGISEQPGQTAHRMFGDDLIR